MIYTTSLSGFNYRYALEEVSTLCDTIIFIGGAFQSLESINKPHRLWPKDINSIIIELPGFGLSDQLPADYDLQFYVDCIDKVIKEENLSSNLIAYSYSYGTAALYRYVLQNESRFKCLIVGGATTRFNQGMIDQINILIELAESDEQLFKKKFIDTFVSDQLEPKVYRKTKILLKHSLKATTSKDIKSFAHNYRRLLREHEAVSYVNTPTLAMIGEHDRFTKFQDLEDLHKNFSQITTVELSDCDHFYQIQTDQSLDYVSRFISRNSESSNYVPNHDFFDSLEELKLN